jgi:hypothetical protein
MGDSINAIYNFTFPVISRRDAMSVPALKRCRDLLCTVGTIPLEYKKKSTGEEIPAPRWVHQLSKSQPQFVTLSWLVDSLLFYGQAFLEITEVYSEDGRGASFEWVSNTRVTFDLDIHNTFVTQYYVDGSPRPMSGLGSLVTFQAFNEGILNTGSRTIQSAIETRLSMDDISTAGHYVKFDLDSSFLRVEPMERLLVLEKMLSLGLISTEQAMEMEDLTPNGSDD